MCGVSWQFFLLWPVTNGTLSNCPFITVKQTSWNNKMQMKAGNKIIRNRMLLFFTSIWILNKRHQGSVYQFFPFKTERPVWILMRSPDLFTLHHLSNLFVTPDMMKHFAMWTCILLSSDYHFRFTAKLFTFFYDWEL